MPKCLGTAVIKDREPSMRQEKYMNLKTQHLLGKVLKEREQTTWDEDENQNLPPFLASETGDNF